MILLCRLDKLKKQISGSSVLKPNNKRWLIYFSSARDHATGMHSPVHYHILFHQFPSQKISIPGKYLFICWCGAYIHLRSCVIPLKLNSGIFDWFRSNVVLATVAVKVKMALWKHPDIWCWYQFRLHNFIKMAKYKRIDFSLIVV